jgi:hypothetical protein
LVFRRLDSTAGGMLLKAETGRERMLPHSASPGAHKIVQLSIAKFWDNEFRVYGKRQEPADETQIHLDNTGFHPCSF